MKSVYKNKYKQVKDNNRTKFLEFEKLFDFVMKWEGGGKLHNVSGDVGGWTKYGIAYNYWKSIFNGLDDFKRLTEDEAKMFFYYEFYMEIEAYRLPCDVELYAFDSAVNLGAKRVIKWLQVCGETMADGIIGPKTRKSFEKVTLECMHRRRVEYYKRQAGRYASQKKFLKGWLNRANDAYNVSRS